MNWSRTILAVIGFCVLTALGVAAPRTGEKASDAPPAALKDLKGVRQVVFSPDGKSLLIHFNVPPTAGGVARVGVWDVETGQHRIGMEKAPGSCEQIAFSPDGAKAAGVANGSKQLVVWDAATGKAAQEFALPEWTQFIPGAPFLGFLPDGNTLATVHKTQVVQAKLGGEVKPGPDAPEIRSPETTAFAPGTGTLIFAVNPKPGMKDGGKFLICDLTKADEPQTVPFSGWVRSLAVTPDGKTLAVAYDWTIEGTTRVPGKVELWDAQAWKVQSTLPQDKRKDFLNYARLMIAPDAKTLGGLATFDRNRPTALELFAADGTVLRDVIGPLPTADLTFSPDGKTAVVVAVNKPLQFIDAATGKDKKPDKDKQP